jgi:hypothetical protein
MELERDYRDIDSLREHPEVAKFAEWIARKPKGFKPQVNSQKRG